LQSLCLQASKNPTPTSPRPKTYEPKTCELKSVHPQAYARIGPAANRSSPKSKIPVMQAARDRKPKKPALPAQVRRPTTPRDHVRALQ
jgi:hypothetical protein